MSYALIKNRSVVEYPLEEGAIKSRFANTSFASPFTPPSDYVQIADAPQPKITYAQNIAEGVPEDVEGAWTRTWIVTDATFEQITERTEKQSTNIRVERNRRLADCDWTQLPDSPADHEAWATYRQALRDVTAQEGFPWEVVWPEAP
jgi:hypothetical protein